MRAYRLVSKANIIIVVDRFGTSVSSSTYLS